MRRRRPRDRRRLIHRFERDHRAPPHRLKSWRDPGQTAGRHSRIREHVDWHAAVERPEVDAVGRGEVQESMAVREKLRMLMERLILPKRGHRRSLPPSGRH